MLQTPLFEKYRNGDFVQFNANTLEIFSSELVDKFKVTTLFAPYHTTLQRLFQIWQPLRGSDITPELAAIDAERDHTFDGLRLTVETWSIHHFNTPKKEAAYRIHEMISNSGKDIARYRYQQQTATLNSIIQHLENTLADEVALLNLGDWVTNLKMLNTQFNNKYMQRNAEVPVVVPEEVQTLRTKATTEYRELMEGFEARYRVAKMDGDPDLPLYEQVEMQMNTLITSYNEAVDRYTDNNDSDTPPTDAPATPPTPPANPTPENP